MLVNLSPCRTLHGHSVTSPSSRHSSPFRSRLVGRQWASHRRVCPATPTPSSGGVLHPDSGSGVSSPCSTALAWCNAQWSVLYSHAFSWLGYGRLPSTRFVLEPCLLTHQPLRPPKTVKMNYWSMTQGAHHSIHFKHGRQKVTSGRSSVANRMCGRSIPASSPRAFFSSSISSLALAGILISSRTGCPAYGTSPLHSSSPICRRIFYFVPGRY